MADEKKKKWTETLKGFPKTFWVVIVFEFFERGAYYGMMSFLSVYLIEEIGLAKEQVGLIKGTIQPLLYFLPIISGALADRFGYRRTLMVAFAFLGGGYMLTSQAGSYATVFLALVVMGLGAGTFKPVISGTIARTTDESNSTIGFGIYYWSINLGAFLFPLILVPWLKNSIGPEFVIIASGICTGIMILPTIFGFKEPEKAETDKSIALAMVDVLKILFSPFIYLYYKFQENKEAIQQLVEEKTKESSSNFKFLLMIFIYSGFWVLYFQMFDSVLWYVKDYVDPSSLDRAVNGLLHAVGLNINWRFDVEHVTVINAGTIIILQIFISMIVRNLRALPTMLVGIGFGTLGMAILAISTNIWVFVLGIIIFSIGEMTAHPKFISYIGLTAPRDKVAMFMGYIFLYGVIGSSIGAILGANLYVHFVDELNQPRVLWLIFSSIGVATIIGLILYDRFVAPEAREEKGEERD